MNKPRLIDANKLYKLIEENSYTLVDRINSKDKGMFLVGIKEAIDKTPTAYDIDKVVEELNFEKGVAFMTLGNTGDEDYDFAYDNVMSYMNKAIDIVRKGGVADET